ncbi:MAG: CRTAC1 family protein, partial [Verrucomicrobiales bacterium]|nr:CRTAC1 family protein [Verrucomicrobiales bacterium]
LEHYVAFRRAVDSASWRLDYRQSAELAFQTALCWLRLGEQENCLAGHNPESCLLPIRGGGVHREKRGALGALAVLRPHLEAHPNDLAARWLFNVAAMTAGTYPTGVPAAWLIPPSAFASEYDVGRFPDVAETVGIAVDDLAGGVVVDDFDRDGLLDVMVSTSRLDGSLRLFRNRGDGRFEERTRAAGLAELTGGLNLVQTDYDNDGWIDVFVLRGAWLGRGGRHPNSLLRNRGDGTFEDVTEAAGLLSFHPTQTAAWFDFDGDGWLDLFVGNESRAGDPHPCELYRNNRDGTFRECAAASGVAVVGFIKAVATGDFDDDGRPDLYLSNVDGPNQLFRNAGPASTEKAGEFRWRFDDVTAPAGVAEPLHSFPAWFWDYDNDGRVDLFVSGYRYSGVGDIAADYLGLEHAAERPRLYRNLGGGRFADVTRAAGLHRLLLAMGANFGDLDNDGWLDFYVGTGDPDLGTLVPNRMFRNDGGRGFQDVGTSGGFGHLQKGHGIAFADLDNDGDQDVYHVVGGAMEGDHYHHALFLNPGHGHRWIHLRLEGSQANRPAIGARLKLTIETPNGTREVHRTVGSGGSFGSSPLRQEIGLGDATRVRELEIHWPGSGRIQVAKDLAPNLAYDFREGVPQPTVISLRRIALTQGDNRGSRPR